MKPNGSQGLSSHQWENRITGFDPSVDPATLNANPGNARLHSSGQRAAIRGTLDKVGWVAPVLVNQRTGHVIDGHMRVEEAVLAEGTVPVMYLDLDPGEEAHILATFDPIGALADYDEDALKALLAETGATGSETLDKFLQGLAGVTADGVDTDKEWEGMPEYESVDLGAKHRVTVSFRSDADADAFFDLLGYPKSASIWWPESDGHVGSTVKDEWVADPK